MSTIVTRAGKGSALTWNEGDSNFTNLNTDKLENITLRADSGTDTQITSNEIVTISGGTGLSSVISASSSGASTVTVNLDNTTVTPNTYTLATITVDAQGRITSASNGTGGGGLSNVVEDTTPQLGGNLDVNGYTITSVSNANVEISPDGTGDVYLTADTVRVGDSNTDVTVTTNGTGDLILNTNAGTNSGSIRIYDGVDGNIEITTNGTGDLYLYIDTLYLDGDVLRVGNQNSNATITTNGTGDLTLSTNQGTNSGTITIYDGLNSNIVVEPSGTGRIYLSSNSLYLGDLNADITMTTYGTGDLILNTNAGANSSSIRIYDGSNGNIVLSPNNTGRVQILGTTANAGGIELYEDTDNGSNYAYLTAPASLASNVTLTLPSTTATLGYLNLPAVGTKTTSYSLATTDVGKYVQVGSGGSITIPDATFAEGDALVIANNTTGNITITCSITTAYIAGTNTDKATMTLATRGVANVLFLSSTVCIVSGNVT